MVIVPNETHLIKKDKVILTVLSTKLRQPFNRQPESEWFIETSLRASDLGLHFDHLKCKFVHIRLSGYGIEDWQNQPLNWSSYFFLSLGLLPNIGGYFPSWIPVDWIPNDKHCSMRFPNTELYAICG
jgi:hypothetical protein